MIGANSYVNRYALLVTSRWSLKEDGKDSERVRLGWLRDTKQRIDETELLETADFSRRNHWFPREITSERRAQKFHSDHASLTKSG